MYYLICGFAIGWVCGIIYTYKLVDKNILDGYNCEALQPKQPNEAFQYYSHHRDCLCSQERGGQPTWLKEYNGYRTLYGYGSDEQWYARGEQPKCSCGLSEDLKKKGIECS